MNWTGDKIKDLRLRLGWSQAELARRLGCRQQTVSEWETGVYLPQNAYSQLLERLLSGLEPAAAQTRARPLAEAVMKNLGVNQVSAEVVEERSDSFDLGID